MNKAEFEEMTANTDAWRDLTVRRVNGGFVIVGNSRYIDRDTGSAVLASQNETIAVDAADVGKLAESYLSTGEFA